MKRAGNLYDLIAEPANLRLAFWKAQRGKQDRPDVIRYRERLDRELDALRFELLDGFVTVGDYRYFTVHDPKERRICAAPFRERVLHHALMNICEPVLERYAIFDSYACRTGKGSHAALRRAQEFARSFPWYLKLDIAKYFDRIPHDRLLRLLERRFKDRRLLLLLRRIIESYAVEPGQGLPIGNLTSQHFANYYLGIFDHFVKEELRLAGYVRYMDDMLLWGESRAQLREILDAVRTFLGDHLDLRVKEAVELKPTATGVSFLGYRVFPGRITLGRRARRRFADKLAALEQALHEGTLDETAAARRVEALIGVTRHAAAHGFRTRIMAELGARRRARTASNAAGVGTTTTPTTSGAPTATTTTRRTGTTTTGFAWPSCPQLRRPPERGDC